MRTSGLFIIVALAFPGILHAQQVLTLDSALRTGLENNYGIRLARNTADISKQNATAGNAGFLPKLTASALLDKSVTDANIKVVSGVELQNSSANTDFLSAGVNLKWTLFDGMNMFINREKLFKLRDMGELEYKIAVENALSQIMVKYFDVVQQKKLLGVLREQVALSEYRTQIAETKKNIGSGSEMELLQSQVDLTADNSALFNQKINLENAKTSLNELLAREVNIDFDVPDTLLLASQMDFKTLYADAAGNNRNLQAKKADKDLSVLEVKGLRAQQYPSVYFLSSYTYLNTTTEASFVKFSRNFGPLYGLGADFSLFDGFNQRRKVQNARLSLMSADIQLQSIRTQLDATLKRTYNEYTNYLQQVEYELKNISLARRNLEVSQEGYKVGTVSPLQLREAQKDLLYAYDRLISAQFKAKQRETELLRISGKLVK